MIKTVIKKPFLKSRKKIQYPCWNDYIVRLTINNEKEYITRILNDELLVKAFFAFTVVGVGIGTAEHPRLCRYHLP